MRRRPSPSRLPNPRLLPRLPPPLVHRPRFRSLKALPSAPRECPDTPRRCERRARGRRRDPLQRADADANVAKFEDLNRPPEGRDRPQEVDEQDIRDSAVDQAEGREAGEERGRGEEGSGEELGGRGADGEAHGTESAVFSPFVGFASVKAIALRYVELP